MADCRWRTVDGGLSMADCRWRTVDNESSIAESGRQQVAKGLLTLEMFEFIFHISPFFRIGKWVFALGDVWPGHG